MQENYDFNYLKISILKSFQQSVNKIGAKCLQQYKCIKIRWGK